MGNISKRNHFIPQFLLNKFSNNQIIFTFDKINKTFFPVSIKNAAVINNLYSIDIDGIPKDFLEKLFSEIESYTAPILQSIVDSKELPTNQNDLSNLFLFIALLSARIPSNIENIRQFNEEIIRIAGIQIIDHQYDKIHESVRKRNKTYLKISKEELIKLYSDPNKIKISIDNEMLMDNMTTMIRGIYDSLYHRNWYIAYISENKSNIFVTCDTPVLLYWKKPMEFYSPGFMLPETVLAFAIDPKVLICSEMEDVPKYPVSVKNYIIREHNFLSTRIAKKYIYSSNKSYNLLDLSRKPCTIEEYFKQKENK